jgi:hypothetical protein
MDIQIQTYEVGTSSISKKNNWSLLERIFTKYNIPIPRTILNQVADYQQKSIIILLTILYGHVHSKLPSQNGESDLPSRQKPLSNESLEIEKRSRKSSFITEMEKNDQIPKLLLLRSVCSLFGITEQTVSFNRGSYKGEVVQEMLCSLVNTQSYTFRKDHFASLLNQSQDELIQNISAASSIEYQLLLDTFLPLLIQCGTASNSFQG